jgi:hypothetical protein
VLFGIVFLGVADNAIESSTDFLSHTGALFFFLFCGFMTAPDIALEFIDHRPIFEREFRTGHYHLVSHAIVNIIREVTIVLVQCLSAFPVAFFAIGFKGRFWYLFLVYFANVFSFGNPRHSDCISMPTTKTSKSFDNYHDVARRTFLRFGTSKLAPVAVVDHTSAIHSSPLLHGGVSILRGPRGT